MPSKAKSSPAPLSEDAIRHRAYLMWEADGRPDGMAEHYWNMAAQPPEMPAKAKAAKAPKAKATAKAPKLKAAAAKIAAPAVKAKPAAKAPGKKAAKKA